MIKVKRNEVKVTKKEEEIKQQLAELNPKIYTLELSTLSSSSLSSSSTSSVSGSTSSSRSVSPEPQKSHQHHHQQRIPRPQVKKTSSNQTKVVPGQTACRVVNKNPVTKVKRHATTIEATKTTTITRKPVSNRPQTSRKQKQEEQKQQQQQQQRDRCVSRLVVRSSSSELCPGVQQEQGMIGKHDDDELRSSLESACSSKTSIKASLLVNNNGNNYHYHRSRQLEEPEAVVVSNHRKLPRQHQQSHRSNSCKKRKIF